MKTKITKKAKSAPDILGIINPSVTERILVLDPREDYEKMKDKLYAQTYCEITFDKEANIQMCINALRESDEALKKRPDSHKLWNWEKTYREGMIIIFGVNWYDKEFFNNRKDAFKDSNHIAQYMKFGAKVSDFKVSHKILK